MLSDPRVQERKYWANAATGGVVLASGDFQLSPALPTTYLGAGWDLARVRGCAYNRGDGHEMAGHIGARLAGNYSGYHSVAQGGNSPIASADRRVTNQFIKSRYPLCVIFNAVGKRFLDERFDLRNFTYAVFWQGELEAGERYRSPDLVREWNQVAPKGGICRRRDAESESGHA